MEGITASVLTANRIVFAIIEFSLAYSVRYIAVIVPNGTAAIDMIITNKAVPYNAGKIPPFVIPSVGKLVKNSHESVSLPPMKITSNMMITMAIISKAETKVIPSMTMPFIFFLKLFIIFPVFFS